MVGTLIFSYLSSYEEPPFIRILFLRLDEIGVGSTLPIESQSSVFKSHPGGAFVCERQDSTIQNNSFFQKEEKRAALGFGIFVSLSSPGLSACVIYHVS